MAGEVSPDDVSILADLGGQAFADDIVAVFKNLDTPSDGPKSATALALEDKVKRGQLHQEVRRIFSSRLETTTNDDGQIVAKAAPKKGRNRGGRNNNRKSDKPKAEFLHFTLYKDNRDTMDAVNQISRLMNVRTQAIGYAGTKDRRASTAQRCSIRYARERSLAAINGKLWGVVTGDYDYKDVPVHLGQLQGNQFTITIKNCDLTGDVAAKPLSEKVEILRENTKSSIEHMAKHGWINYFGHQRFGTRDVGTHDIGTLILADKFEEAVDALLTYDAEIAEKAENGEIPPEATARDEALRHQACMLFKTDKDAERAARIIPRRFSAENCILRHLTRAGAQSRRDFVGAIVHITRGLRSMYLHAYQSHVWNHVASKRWETHGEKVVAGDLVIADNEAQSAFAGKDEDGDDIINPVEDDDGLTVRARPLSEEEASSGRYTIHDIVLPSPGYEVIYPSNDMGKYYEEFMGLPENGGLDPHQMRRRHREFSLPGRYRKLMNRFLGQPSVEVKTYADDTEQMHPTDLDILRAAKRGKRSRDQDSDGPPGKRAKQDVGDEDATMPDAEAKEKNGESTEAKEQESEQPEPAEPSKIAVIVKFQLGRSAYATVTLRELMGDAAEEP